MGTINVKVVVTFPGLDALVAYLVSRADQQKQTDALTAQVEQLTLGLAKSGASLTASLNT